MRLRYEIFFCEPPRGLRDEVPATMKGVWSAPGRVLSSIWVQRARIGNPGGGGTQALSVARHRAKSWRWLEMPSRWYARFW